MRMYLQCLLAEFCRLRPEHTFILFTPRWADPLLDDPPPNLDIIRLPGVPANRTLRIVYQQTAFPAALAAHKLDAFFATATVTPWLARVPTVLAVQFLQFYEMPEAYGRLRTAYLRLFLPLSLQRARRALIFTEASRRDLLRHTGAAAEKITVVPHGLSPEVWAVAASADGEYRDHNLGLTQGRPYILYVSATYGYKNHLRLIRAFARFKEVTRLPHALLLVGSEVSVPFDALRSEASRAGVEKDVIIAGRLPNAAVTYRDAALSVIPTLAETFGFPVLEAMACGCPVVTSNRGSMAELAGDAAVLVDPGDEQAIADGMRRVLTDPHLHRSLSERGRQRAAGYTWARAAAQTLALLEEAAQS